MEILCFGLSHHTAPIELREKLAIPDAQVAPTAVELAQRPGLGEAVIVSTCNRVEFYVAAEDTAHALTSVEQFVLEKIAAPAGEAFFQHPTPRSIRHLFSVVSGLDSMVMPHRV